MIKDERIMTAVYIVGIFAFFFFEKNKKAKQKRKNFKHAKAPLKFA